MTGHLARRLALWRTALVGLALTAPRTPAGAQPRGPRALDASRPIGTFVATGEERDGYRAADRHLADWALAAWQHATNGRLTLTPASEDGARVRLYWAGPQSGQYGGLAQSDPLFRDTVVYLTCLHELGHAFDLEHTDDYRDIMYSFQYGGDIVEYFARFRRQLKTRTDIASVSGMSDGDVTALRRLYPAR